MELGTTFKPLAISLFTAIALTACGGGGGDGGVADRTTGPNNIPSVPKADTHNNNTNNQNRNSSTAEWRRIDGFKQTNDLVKQPDAFRHYSENINTSFNGVRHQEDYNLSAFYFNGGKGLHSATTPGGGKVDYYNMSYATFGNYKRLVNNFDDVFYVVQETKPQDIPISGSANYVGSILYRGTEDGKISLNVDYSTRDITGSVENSSFYDNEKLRLKGFSFNDQVFNKTTISGTLFSEGNENKGNLNARFAGPHAEEIVGELHNRNSREQDYNNAVFGAAKQ